MLKQSSKRPRDTSELARRVADLATGEVEDNAPTPEKESQLHIVRYGQVVTGRGNATPLLSGRRELFDYFGAEPQPGSLNIILDWPILFRPERATARLENHLLTWPARVEGQPCLIQRWRNCPLHVVELISPCRFQIQKGSRTLVEFDVADTAPIPLGRLFGWGSLWFLHRPRVYSDDKYFYWAGGIAARYPAWLGQQTI